MHHKVAVIGHGYWGKNIARVFNSSADFDLSCICDLSDETLSKVSKIYRNIATTKDISAIPSDVDTVAIITPVHTHYDLALRFLREGKNVLVTKPCAAELSQVEHLFEVAEENDRTLFVDHTFVFHPAVRALKELLPKIGQPYYVLSRRLNLGLFQPDVNVILDLMPHDISIVSYLFDEPVSHAITSAFSVSDLPHEDTANTSFTLLNGIKGHITASWLAPAKIRDLTIVGSRGMLTYDDVAVAEKIRFYDKGIAIDDNDPESVAAAYTARISYRAGDMYSPAIPNYEALGEEVKEFARAIEDRSVRDSYNQLNLNIAKGLQAIVDGQKSGLLVEKTRLAGQEPAVPKLGKGIPVQPRRDTSERA